DDDDVDKTKPSRPSTNGKPNGKPAKAAVRRDDDDADEDRPSKTRPRAKKKPQNDGNGGMILLIGGGAVGLIALVAVGIYLAFGNSEKKDTAKNDSTPAATTPTAGPGG